MKNLRANSRAPTTNPRAEASARQNPSFQTQFFHQCDDFSSVGQAILTQVNGALLNSLVIHDSFEEAEPPHDDSQTSGERLM